MAKEKGHVFVALNNTVKISADSWCLTGTAWWQDADLNRSGTYRFTNESIASLREAVEMNGPREQEILQKAAHFGHDVVTDLPVPDQPDEGFSRVAVLGRGSDRLGERPPVGVFTSVRVPKPVISEGRDRTLNWLMTSLEEYLVAAARWLASPRDKVANAIWAKSQLDPASIWEILCPGGDNLTDENMLERIRGAVADQNFDDITQQRVLQMMESLQFYEGRRCMSGVTLLKERGPAGISLTELQQALYRGEPPRARRKCHLLTAPVLGTGAGGAKADAGKVVENVMKQLLDVTYGTHELWPKNLDGTPKLADVVLVCPDKQIFSMAQSWRLANLGEAFPQGSLTSDEQKQAYLRSKARWLGEQASSGRLAIFIGAGVSAGAGLPSWFAVLAEVEKDIEDLQEAITGQRPKLNMGDRTAENGSWDPLNYASGLQDELEKNVPAHVYRSRFPASDAQGGAVEPTAELMLKELVCRHLKARFHSLNHALLAGMPVDKMVTQNYDKLLEQASNDVDMFNKARPFSHDRLSVLPLDAKADCGRWLLKMHGTLDNPESIVITKKDYDVYDSKSQALAGLVQGTMLTCHMFFIGFSGVDTNYKKILKAVKDSKPEKDRKGMATLLKIINEGETDGDESVERVLFDDNKDIPNGARLQEVFVDLLALYAQATSPKAILDPRVQSALNEDEMWLKEQCERFFSNLDNASDAVRSTPTYGKVMQMLEDLGLPHNRSTSKQAERALNKFEKMRCAMDVMDEESLRALLDTAKTAYSDGLHTTDLDIIADFAFKKSSAQQVKLIFDKYDTDGNGTISLDELRVTLRRLDPQWNEFNTRKLFGAIDKDRTGSVNYQEFVSWVCEV